MVNKRDTTIRWAILFAVMLTVGLLQGVVGSIPTELFAMPLNLLILVLWLCGVWWLTTHRHTSKIATMLHSMRATQISLVVLILLGIAFGVQSKPATTSWPAVVSLLFVMTHLALITIRGARDAAGRWRWSFLLNHCGLLLALVAGFWGSADRREWKVIVSRPPVECVAYTSAGSASHIDYTMWLKALRTEHFDNGTLAHSEAELTIDGRDVALRVNDPYNRTWCETIYLTGYDTTSNSEARYVTVEVVRDAWRWLKFAGIAMLLLGAFMMFTERKS